MDKKQKSYIGIYIIILFLFNIVFFCIPLRRNSTSWIMYIFANISIIFSGIIGLYVYQKGQKIQSKLYGFPIVKVGLYYMIVQMIITGAFLLFGIYIKIASWIAIVTNVVILAITLIGLIITDNAEDIVEYQDISLKNATKIMTEMKVKVDGMVVQCNSENIKRQLIKLSEQLRYSDPVSSMQLGDIEEALKQHIDALQTLIDENDYVKLEKEIKQTEGIIKQRNNMCKIMK